MHVRKRVGRVIGTVVGFAVWHRRLTVAVVIVALLVGPLALTRDGEVFALNVIGLGVTLLTVRRLVKFGRRRTHGDR